MPSLFKRRESAEKTKGEILAYQYLATILMVKYNVRLGFGVSTRNYAHEVWKKNMDIVPTAYIKGYQADIEDYIISVRNGVEYQQLLNGTADPLLIIDTHIRYAYVKKCGG